MRMGGRGNRMGVRVDGSIRGGHPGRKGTGAIPGMRCAPPGQFSIPSSGMTRAIIAKPEQMSPGANSANWLFSQAKATFQNLREATLTLVPL
jgi:hypothetical protein